MRILVCVKRVPVPGARIPVTDDGQAVDDERLGHTISPHEECAVEEAVQLVEQHGGSATVLTVGPSEADEQVRYGVSLGVQHGALVTTDGTDWDPQRTSRALVDAIRRLEEADGEFDLILFGNESADAGNFQVGIRVAHALDRPIVQGIKEIAVNDDTVQVQRPTGTASEVYDLPLPACLGVLEGLNLPRYPTMRGRLAAKKATVDTVAAGEVAAGGQTLVMLESPPVDDSPTEVMQIDDGAVARVVDILTELKVLS